MFVQKCSWLLLCIGMVTGFSACEFVTNPPPPPPPMDTAPTAAFTADETSGPAPSLIAFTDTSTPGTAAITQWAWDFGDETTSNAQNPVHDYGTPGMYTVALTVTTTVGANTATQRDYIEIVAVPPRMPTVVAPAGAVTGSSVTLSGTTSPGATLLFTGGAENATATADEEGAYTAMVPIGANRITRLFVTASLNGMSSPPVPVEITQDAQAPTVFIDVPADGSTVTQDMVTVAGRVGDMLSGFEALEVTLSGLNGQVAQAIGNMGTFEVRDVPLTLGANILEVVAMDAAGNTKADTITVTRVDPTGDRLNVVSGNNQTGMVRMGLADPIAVVLQDENEAPIAGRALSFTVVRSDGRLDDGTDFMDARQALELTTDANGMATAFWILGTDAGCGNNRVQVRDTVSGSTVMLCASAEASAPTQLNLVTGNNQRASVNGMTPEKLRVRVSDGDNGVAGVMVDFMAMVGGGQVDDLIVATVATDSSGVAEVSWMLGPDAGVNMVVAEFADNAGEPVFFEAYAVASVEDTTTSLSGIVFDNGNLPVGGAPCTLEINGASVPDVVTDANGRFTFDDIPAGQGHLHVHGLAATQLDGEALAVGSLPDLAVAVTVVANAANSLPSPVLLPLLDPDNARSYDGTQDVELTVAGIEGLRMIVRAGSMRRADGSEPTPADPATLALNQVQTNDIPMPLPNGVASPFAWTLQPSGATFDPPVEIVYPNMAGLPAGTASFFLSFNHDTGAFEVVGTGAVTADGSEIVTDRGSGISVAGWGGNCPPYSATGEVNACEANLSVLLNESIQFLIAVGKDLNKFTKVLGCFNDIVTKGPDCIAAYRAFRDDGSDDAAKAEAALKCAKALKTIANNCAGVFLTIDPFKLAGRAKLLSDAIGRAINVAQANECFVGPTGARVLKGLESINNMINPFLDLANDASPRKLAITLACFFLQTIVDGLEFGKIPNSKQGGAIYSDETLAELDAMFTDLPGMLAPLEEGNDEVLARINDPVLKANIAGAMEEFQGAIDEELTATELAGFTVMVANQITVADEFGLVNFGNITVPDEFGAGGPGTAPDFIGDDILRLVGFKEVEGGTRYVYGPAFQIEVGVASLIEFEDLIFSDTVPPFPQTVALNAAVLSVPVSGATQVALTGTFFNGDQVDMSRAADGTTYRASNTDIIHVSGDGLVTGVGLGVAYVIASNNSATAVRRVTVSDSLISTTVEGVLRDFNGDPVAGALVTTAFGGEGITDETGAFRFDLILPTGTTGVTLNFNVGGDQFNSGVLGVVISGTIDAGEIQYVPSDAMTTVTGQVRRSNDSPVEGATVTTDQGGEGTTDSMGNFSFAVTLSKLDTITAVATFNSEAEMLTGSSEAVVPVIEGTTSVGIIEATQAQQVLYPRQRVNVDNTPGDLAVADLNDDGVLDILTVNESPDTLSLALGNGDGSFALRTDILIGTNQNMGIGINPDALVVADFNNDGALDVVTGNLFVGGISFVPGNGNGTFGTPAQYTTGVSPSSVAAADFDGDGNLDVVTPNVGSHDVSVLLGNGDGTFDDHVEYAVGNGPRFLRVADFNGDDVPDMAVANGGQFGGTVSILLGVGDGTFEDQLVLDTEFGTNALATGDFNGDGNIDIAANRGGVTGDLVSIHHGNGDGTFGMNAEMPVPNSRYLDAVDLNEDGLLDLLVSFSGQQTGVQILEGQGDGTFTVSAMLDGGQLPDRVVPADLNGDGSLDLALVNTQSNDVSIFLAASDGVFDDLRPPAGSMPIQVKLNHMDSDANLDAVVLSSDNGFTPVYTVSVIRANGDGTFQAGLETEIDSNPVALVTGDLNGDDISDVIASRCCDGTADVLLSDGAGGFSSVTSITVGGGLAVLALGDLDGDGNLDIASVERFGQSQDLSIRLGNGDGTFEEVLTFTGVQSGNEIALADMDGDEVLDVVVAAFGGIYIFSGAGDGTFNTPSFIATPGSTVGLAVGDLNGDGATDVVVLEMSSGGLVVALSNGDGTLMAPISQTVFPTPAALALAEVNGDGLLDALVVNELNNSLEVYTGLGDGTFINGGVYGVGQHPVALDWGDLNGDGLLDVVTANERGSNISVVIHE